MDNKPSLADKLVRFFVIFALAIGVTCLCIFALQLNILHRMLRTDEEDQLSVTAGRSEESMRAVTEENLIARIKWAADRTDDEFWIAEHDLKMLQNQVADIYRDPDRYGRRTLYPPSKENAESPALQLLCPNGYENISPKALGMAERLANTEAILREILMKNDFNVDIGVATMDGLALCMDRLSEKKIRDDGSIISPDIRDQIWYRQAAESGQIIFTPIHSTLYDLDEVVFAAPVYVEDEPVAVIWGSMRTDMLRGFLEGRDLGESGFTVLISDKGELVYSPRTSGELMIEHDHSLDIRDRVNPELKAAIGKGLGGETGVDAITVDGEDYYAAYGSVKTNKWTQIIFVSTKEVMDPANELLKDMGEISASDFSAQEESFRNSAVIAVIILAIIILIALAVAGGTAKRRTEPIAIMAKRVAGMSGDDISFDMDEAYKTGDEIELLAEGFEEFSLKTKKYIDEIMTMASEKERVKVEFSLATRIQADMLPGRFPAFPDRNEFDIYASMTPAKEVGGDFYDFFFAGEDKLAMVMADVSGKGVPAAMFMMMAKTMIQGRLVADQDVGRMLEDVNNAICANNTEKMFVTVWVGILDLKSGLLSAANAGHEYPIIKEPDGPFMVLKDKHGFVLGGKKNMKYKAYEIEMKPGSKLFIYTDGVPEAMNEDGQLFGMERTLRAVNDVASSAPQDILANVTRRVGEYVGSAEQFDDLTMMCIEYFGADDGRIGGGD